MRVGGGNRGKMQKTKGWIKTKQPLNADILRDINSTQFSVMHYERQTHRIFISTWRIFGPLLNIWWKLIKCQLFRRRTSNFQLHQLAPPPRNHKSSPPHITISSLSKHCTRCSLGSTMALQYFGYSCKNTFSWENNIFRLFFLCSFRKKTRKLVSLFILRH